MLAQKQNQGLNALDSVLHTKGTREIQEWLSIVPIASSIHLDFTGVLRPRGTASSARLTSHSLYTLLESFSVLLVMDHKPQEQTY